MAVFRREGPLVGGMWERLVRSVKNCLKTVIGLASLKLDELQTLLVEVECIINSRPITYVYDDTDGITYPFIHHLICFMVELLHCNRMTNTLKL